MYLTSRPVKILYSISSICLNKSLHWPWMNSSDHYHYRITSASVAVRHTPLTTRNFTSEQTDNWAVWRQLSVTAPATIGSARKRSASLARLMMIKDHGPPFASGGQLLAKSDLVDVSIRPRVAVDAFACSVIVDAIYA